MKEIWAPWRIEYIVRAKQGGCFLCKSIRSRRDRQNLVLKRGRTCVIVMNRYPYNGGHVMIAPRRHVAELKDMKPAEISEMMAMAIEVAAALRKTIRAEGFNMGINIGEVAGAGLKDHIHLHIVPRWAGDTNFMPVLADTRVIPQALAELWDRLHPELNG